MYMSDKELAARFGVTRCAIWKWVREDHFPAPVKLATRCTRWRLDQVEAWEAARAAA